MHVHTCAHTKKKAQLIPCHNQHVHLSIPEDKYMVPPIVSAHSCLTSPGKIVLACLELGLFFLEAVSPVYVSTLGTQPIWPGRGYLKEKGKRLMHRPPQELESAELYAKR